MYFMTSTMQRMRPHQTDPVRPLSFWHLQVWGITFYCSWATQTMANCSGRQNRLGLSVFELLHNRLVKDMWMKTPLTYHFLSLSFRSVQNILVIGTEMCIRHLAWIWTKLYTFKMWLISCSVLHSTQRYICM